MDKTTSSAKWVKHGTSVTASFPVHQAAAEKGSILEGKSSLLLGWFGV